MYPVKLDLEMFVTTSARTERVVTNSFIAEITTIEEVIRNVLVLFFASTILGVYLFFLFVFRVAPISLVVLARVWHHVPTSSFRLLFLV